MKKVLTLAIASVAFHIANGQTLFTYGTKKVDKKEFLQAYDKNPSPINDRQQGLKEYLDLYINYKLKVQAAYDEKLGEQQGFKYESNNFKKQLAENEINEEANIKTLVEEAFQRSKKDIHVAQIFIEVSSGSDTLEAYKQIQKAYSQLKAGKDFGEVSSEFSNDEGTKQSKGDLGYITVFTLPYSFETEVYTLSPGTFSAPYRSNIGYHIFKNVSERPAIGKRKVAQILLSLPGGASEETQQRIKSIADTVYAKALRGEPFKKLVTEFSTDRATFSTNGVLPEFGIGQYNPVFESHAFALKNIGDVGKPFKTEYGWHIIQLADVNPVSKDINDPVTYSLLKQQVERDNRLSAVKKSLTKKWMSLCKFKENSFDKEEFKLFSDSAFAGKSLAGFTKVTPSTVLFSFEKQNITGGDWAKFARAVKQSGSPISKKSLLDMFREYELIVCGEYYRDHLEDFNASLRQQSKEFDEANLLFAAMDKNVWGRASEDTIGLKKYYSEHASKYTWGPSLSALVVTCTGKDLANEVAAKIKTSPVEWRAIVGSYGNNVVADSSRYEQNQLPLKQRIDSKVGFLSSPEKTGGEDTYTFIFVTEVFDKAEPKSFDDARGIVISDYQQVLEQNWVAELRKKYPVKVNEEVWKTVK